jgi:hypothetical protein
MARQTPNSPYGPYVARKAAAAARKGSAPDVPSPPPWTRGIAKKAPAPKTAKFGQGNYWDTDDNTIAKDTRGPISNERDVKRQMVDQDLAEGGTPGAGKPYTLGKRRATKSLSKGRR